MFKYFSKIFAGYGWTNGSDLFLSIIPSAKYHITLGVVMLSSVFTSMELLLGINHATMVAFAILALAELVTGLYASVVVRKEKLQSGKMGRFTFKLGMIFIVIYVINTFMQQFQATSPALHTLFDWMYTGVFAYSALEYLVSVLENVAVITGKESSTLIMAIKEKLNSLLK